MSVTGMMPTTVTIQRPTAAYDDAREATVTFADVGTMRCALFPKGASSMQEVEGKVLRVDGRGYAPAGTDLRPDEEGRGDRIVLSSGEIFYVVGVVDEGSRGHHLKFWFRKPR